MADMKSKFGRFRKNIEEAGSKAAKSAQENADRLARKSMEMAESTLPKFEILEEINTVEREDILETKRYPLDNRAGSDTLESTEVISKTIKSELTLENQHLLDAGVNVAGLRMIGAQISSRVGKSTSHSVGQSITRSQSLTFKAAPGSYSIYTVVWKQTTREGTYVVEINNKRAEIPYKMILDLSYEVSSETRA